MERINYPQYYVGNRRVVEWRGEARSISAWADILDMRRGAVTRRVDQGLPLDYVMPQVVRGVKRTTKKRINLKGDSDKVCLPTKGEKVCPLLAEFARMRISDELQHK